MLKASVDLFILRGWVEHYLNYYAFENVIRAVYLLDLYPNNALNFA